MHMARKEKIISLALILAGLLPFAYAVSLYLAGNLWGDELHSIYHYSSLGLLTTVTTFGDTNNHVFFNVIMSLVLKVLGLHDMDGAIDNVVMLRSVQMVFGILTFIYVYLYARRFIGSLAANLSVILLSTTIPFLNFAFQLRGYSLSILLVAALLYHAQSYLAKPSKLHAALTVISTACLFYTVPSNIYFIVALMAVLIVEYGAGRVSKSPAGFSGKSVMICLAVIFCGCILAVLAYAPLIKLILACPYVSRTAETRFYVPGTLLPAVSSMMLSTRYLLPVASLAGIGIFSLRLMKTGERSGKLSGFFRLALLYTFPFLVSFARNDFAFDRSFVMLAPVFSLLLASGMGLFVASLPPVPGIGRIVACCTVLFCLATFGWTMHSINEVLKDDITTGTRHLDLLRNYHQSRFYRPYEDLGVLVGAYQKNPRPVIVIGDVDLAPVYSYLDRLKINDYYSVRWVEHDDSGNTKYMEYRPGPAGTEGHGISMFKVNKSYHLKDDELGLFAGIFLQLTSEGVLLPDAQCYLVTACPQRLLSILQDLSLDFHPEQLNPVGNYTNIIRVTVPAGIYVPP